MRIEVVDPNGHGLGLAIGLCQLGHEVRYVEAHPPSRPEARNGQAIEMKRDLVARFFASSPCAAEPDLLVLVDVFGDYLHCLWSGIGDPGQSPATHAMQVDAGVAVYPLRLQHLAERAQAADHVAVIDMADHRLRETAFEALPHPHLFAREVHGTCDGRWQPFPFLYNLPVLWLEYTQPRSAWVSERPASSRWDWVFCGTLANERYGDRRKKQVSQLAERWPQLRGAVLGDRSFVEVLGALQSTRVGLDLAGAGELCFRQHECLALGTPLWRPFASPVLAPPGLRDVVVADLDAAIADVGQVRAIYAEHYAPSAAATWLLDRCSGTASQPHQYSISQATNIAPAASK